AAADPRPLLPALPRVLVRRLGGRLQLLLVLGRRGRGAPLVRLGRRGADRRQGALPLLLQGPREELRRTAGLPRPGERHRRQRPVGLEAGGGLRPPLRLLL